MLRTEFDNLISREDVVGMHAIGRALVHLLNRQTADEQQINDTRYHNERGFTPSDARRGSITAKYYIKHKRLEDWQQDYWLQPNVKGCARIGKYYRQIAEEAAKHLTNT